MLPFLRRVIAFVQAVEPYETLTGEHFLGEARNLPGRYDDGQRPRWVKFVTDANYAASRAQFLPAGTGLIWRLFEKGPFNSNKLNEWLGNDSPKSSAERLANHLDAELRIIADIPGRKKAVDGPFNEVGHGVNYAIFCFEFAKILWNKYGLLLAAFGSSTGSYNEIEHAEIMAAYYIKPCIDAGIPCYLGLHAYASLYPPVWNGAHRLFESIRNIWNSGARGDIFGLNDFLPASVLDENEPPQTYTGFGWIRLLWFLKNVFKIDLKKIHLLVTEGGLVDNVSDPGIGAVAGGWRQWVERGLWDKLRLDNPVVRAVRRGLNLIPGIQALDSYDMVAARGLLYIEQQCRIFYHLLGDLATMPFTDTDQQTGSRWHLEYRLIEVMPLFKQMVRALGGLPPAGCQIAASKGLAINIRQQPTTNAAIVGELAIGATIEPLATIRDADGKVWYRTALGFIASFAAITVSGCDGLPDETRPPDDEEENTMGTLNLVMRDLNPATMANLNAQMGGDLFVNLGDARTGAEAQLSKHVGRFWLDWHPGHPGQDFGNNNTFMARVSGGAVDIAETTLLAHPIFKNYINDYQEYWWQGGAVNEYNQVMNEFFAPHVLISPPINADECPPHKLSLMAAIQAHVVLRLKEYTDPASTKLTFRGLHGCYIGRDIGLDEDRAAFLNDMRPILEAVRNYGGVFEMKRKLDAPAFHYHRSSVMPDEDIAWLKANGFGSVPLLLVVEWRDGFRGVGMTPKQTADSLWLLYQTVQTYTNLDVAVALYQDGERFNADGTPEWGNGHNLQGAALDTFLAYKSGTQTPPLVGWLPDIEPPPGEGDGCIPLLSRALRSLAGQ